MNAEGIIARSDLKEQIEAAANEGNYSSLAALYAELVSRNPTKEDLRILEIETLERNYAFVEAEAKANAATKLFPRSLTMAQRFADCAFQLQNWQVAANQFQSLRSRFDPREHFGAAASILDEFKCYACMTDETAACALVEAHWHTIKSYDARQYGGRIEVFEIGEFIRAEDFQEFTNWSSQAVPHEGREGYMRRLGSIAKNKLWVESHAPSVDLVSLGQNCLPWILPNRWGLRPRAAIMSPFGPFDFLAMLNDTPATLLENDFESLLASENLQSGLVARKIPFLHNGKLGANFFHEQGHWWAEDNWARLRAAYEARIRRYRSGVRSGKRLYIFCRCGADDLGRLIKAYEDRLDVQNAQLLVVNVLKEPAAVESKSTRVTVKNIPYPEDYDWNDPRDYNSPRGQAFEVEVVNAICGELITLND